ncbi:MAG: c-type cytochrome [Glaciimonas sp.]|nr:c-type cytochrome [Glaciimonas sp.]
MQKFTLFALFAFIAPAYAAEDDSHIRTLAASCAACHGTNGVSQGGTPVLAGLDEAYFVKRMLEYQTQTKSTEAMAQNAKGLTSEEIAQLGKYFADQQRSFRFFQKHSLKKQL